MSFMEVYTTDKVWWNLIEGDNGGTVVPFDAVGKLTKKTARDYYDGNEVYSVEHIQGYGCHLSASGYMDQTEWEVFSSKAAMLKRARELERENKGEDY